MTVPVASAASVRTSLPSGTDGDSTGGPPFASALDGALRAGREQGVHTGARQGSSAERRSENADHRAAGHERTDGRTTRHDAGTRAEGPAAPARGSRRAEDRDAARTPSDGPRAGKDAGRSPEDEESATAADAGLAAALGSTIPPAWTLTLTPTAPATTAVSATDPTAAPAAGVPATTSAPAARGVSVDASGVPVALPGLQPDTGQQNAPAAPTPAGPTVVPATQPPAGTIGSAAAAGTTPAVRPGTAPGAAGVALSPASAARLPNGPSSTVPSAAAPAADADPDAPAVLPGPALGLPSGTAPAAARDGSRTDVATAPIPTAGAPADGGTVLPVAGTAPVAGQQGSEGSASSDSGDDPGQDPQPAAPDSSASVVSAAPSPAPAVASVPASATAARVTQQPVAAQVASHVAVLSNGPDGTHSVTVVLHPDSLGPVHVQLTLHQGAVDLTMRGAHEQGRAALLDALPDLRRDLEAAGLTCSSLDVDRDTGGSWSSQRQSSQQQAAQHQWTDQGRRPPEGPDGRFRSWSRTADSGDSRQVPAATRSTLRGVDVRV